MNDFDESPGEDARPKAGGYAATIQWVCDCAGVLRIHPSVTAIYGDPWDWSVFIHRRGDVAMLLGARDAPPCRAATRAMLAELYRAGCRWRVHERRTIGIREIKRPIPAPAG